MARSTKPRKRAPEPPDVPGDLDPAPARLESRAQWECVQAGSDVEMGAHLAQVELRESVWINADLAGRHLSGFRCRDVRFERCDLAGAVLDAASLTRVLFTGCRMTGVVLSGATLQDVHIREVSRRHGVPTDGARGLPARRGQLASRGGLLPGHPGSYRAARLRPARRELPRLQHDRLRPARLAPPRPARSAVAARSKHQPRSAPATGSLPPRRRRHQHHADSPTARTMTDSA